MSVSPEDHDAMLVPATYMTRTLESEDAAKGRCANDLVDPIAKCS